jgi:predicted extracellular nuclease
LETLGSAAFSNKKFPTNKGSVTGVLYRDQKQLKMQIRSLEDVDFNQSYEECAEVIENILITEVADPENSVGARFVELYNAGTTSVSLIGWRLNKYLNGSNSLSSGELDLSGYSIESGGFLIIANTGFNTLFNEQADVVSSYISGNGDDVYELEDSEGSVHDVYGVKGEDGSNMIWEYLDGKAIRKKEVNSSASIFDATEWIIYSKTHGNKQTAPQDFSPNSW